MPRPVASRWLPVALLVAAALLAFWSALSGPFIYDDHSAIVENAHLRSLLPLSTSLGAPPDTPAAGRPIVSLSLALDHAVHGLDPRGFHATNLAVHLLGALVLLALVRRTLLLPPAPASTARARWLGFAVALLWLVHPVQTEVVNYAIQRSESLMSLFYLLTLLLALRARGHTRFGLGGVVACALGMASKESMVTAPVAVVLFDLAYRERGIAEVVRTRAPLWIGLAGTWGVLALLWVGAPRGASVGTGLGVSPLVWALNQSEAVLGYLRLVFWPSELVLDYGLPRTLGLDEVWPQLLGLGAILAGVIALLAARPRAGFPALFFFLALAPTSSLIPIATEVAAERRMHLALAGPLALAVVVTFDALVRRLGTRAAPVGVVLLAGIAATLGAVTHARNLEYQSDVAIWRTVAERAPRNARGHYNLGTVLVAEGALPEAEAAYRRALELEPGYLRARYNLGVVLGMQGRADEAIRALEAALAIDPADPAAHQSLGILREGRGQRREAALHYRRALAREPGRSVAALKLAWILATDSGADRGQRLEAVRLAERVNQATGGADPSVLEVLAAAYAAAGRLDEAAALAERGQRLAREAGAPELEARLRDERDRYARGLPVELQDPDPPSHNPPQPQARPAPEPPQQLRGAP
jgi:tetratricopeptide (TPR) repeat protein